MIIRDEPLLQTMRGAGTCSYCLKLARRLEPAHLFTRGTGGGQRLDLAISVIPMGSAFCCGCHARQHAGNLPRIDPEIPVLDQMLIIAGRRTGENPEDIRLVLQRLQNLSGKATRAECNRVWREVREWSRPAAGLLRRILKEQGMLPMRLCK